MRIYGGQNINLGYAGIGNRNWSQGRASQGINGGMRSDSATISPQGKASGMLTNLLRQKELIQECRDSVIKRATEKQQQGISVNVQEQLKKYDEQLKTVEEQIAKELTRQFEEEAEKEEKKNTYENPRTITRQEAENERMAKVSDLTNTLGQVERLSDIKDSVDGKIRVVESEIELTESRGPDGARTAEGKRKRLSDMKSKSEDLSAMIGEKSGKMMEEQISDEEKYTRVEEEPEEDGTHVPGRLPEEEEEN